MPGAVGIRVDIDKNTVSFHYNGKKQHTVQFKKWKLKGMKEIRACVIALKEGDVVEFI